MSRKENIIATYPTDENKKHIVEMAKENRVSMSTYINTLISKDRVAQHKY